MNILGTIEYKKNGKPALKIIVHHKGKNYEVKKEIDWQKELYEWSFESVTIKEDYSISTSSIPFTTILLAITLIKFVRETLDA